MEDLETLRAGNILDGLSREPRARLHRAGPMRRVYIPKDNGLLWPLGIRNVRLADAAHHPYSHSPRDSSRG